MKAKEVGFRPTITNVTERKKLAASIMKNAFTIGTKRIAWIPVELLNIKAYQRNRQRHVTQIAENWDDAECNVLLVSYDEENGCFNVIDGQHRAIAARMRGVEYLVCEVFMNMNISKEARRFVDGNTGSKKLSPFDTYNANQFITGEEETELSRIDKRIASVCKEYDIQVEKSNARKTLKSVPTARSIIKKGGEEELEFVLKVVTESQWDEFPQGLSADLMNALGKIYMYNVRNQNVIKGKVVNVLINLNPAELIAYGNKKYSSLTRTGRMDAVLSSIVKDDVTANDIKNYINDIQIEQKRKGNITKISQVAQTAI